VPFGVGTDCTTPGVVGADVGAVDGIVPGWVPLTNGVPFGARLLLGIAPLPGAATPGLAPFGVGTGCTRPGVAGTEVGAVDGVVLGAATPGLAPFGVGTGCTTPGVAGADVGAVDGGVPAGGVALVACAVGA
jgi:hypothetical protein